MEVILLNILASQFSPLKQKFLAPPLGVVMYLMMTKNVHYGLAAKERLRWTTNNLVRGLGQSHFNPARKAIVSRFKVMTRVTQSRLQVFQEGLRRGRLSGLNHMLRLIAQSMRNRG